MSHQLARKRLYAARPMHPGDDAGHRARRGPARWPGTGFPLFRNGAYTHRTSQVALQHDFPLCGRVQALDIPGMKAMNAVAEVGSTGLSKASAVASKVTSVAMVPVNVVGNALTQVGAAIASVTPGPIKIVACKQMLYIVYGAQSLCVCARARERA